MGRHLPFVFLVAGCAEVAGGLDSNGAEQQRPGPTDRAGWDSFRIDVVPVTERTQRMAFFVPFDGPVPAVLEMEADVVLAFSDAYPTKFTLELEGDGVPIYCNHVFGEVVVTGVQTVSGQAVVPSPRPGTPRVDLDLARAGEAVVDVSGRLTVDFDRSRICPDMVPLPEQLDLRVRLNVRVVEPAGTRIVPQATCADERVARYAVGRGLGRGGAPEDFFQVLDGAGDPFVPENARRDTPVGVTVRHERRLRIEPFRRPTDEEGPFALKDLTFPEGPGWMRIEPDLGPALDVEVYDAVWVDGFVLETIHASDACCLVLESDRAYDQADYDAFRARTSPNEFFETQLGDRVLPYVRADLVEGDPACTLSPRDEELGQGFEVRSRTPRTCVIDEVPPSKIQGRTLWTRPDWNLRRSVHLVETGRCSFEVTDGRTGSRQRFDATFSDLNELTSLDDAR